jgi:hypothetical protein
VPVKVVSDILGHRSPATTSIYARVALDRLREIALPVPLCLLRKGTNIPCIAIRLFRNPSLPPRATRVS